MADPQGTTSDQGFFFSDHPGLFVCLFYSFALLAYIRNNNLNV